MRTLFKFVLPTMAAFMITMLSWGNDQRMWIVIPTILILLYLSAAELRIEGNHTFYRRFLAWRELPQDITDVRCSLLPALGYIRFRRFMPPFGVLIFIVERGYGRFVPFRRMATMQSMLSAIQLRPDGVDSQFDNFKSEEMDHKSRVIWVLSSIAGLIAGIAIPVPWQQWVISANQSIISRLLQIQLHPVILSLYAIVLVGLIIQDRFRSAASFGLAFLIGTVIAHLAHVH